MSAMKQIKDVLVDMNPFGSTSAMMNLHIVKRGKGPMCA